MNGGEDQITQDAAFGGAVRLCQRRRGYRFTVDALWLVAASLPHARGRVVDLGAGCGVVGLSLATAPGVEAVYLVERQATLAALARQSARRSRPRCAVSVVEADLRQIAVDEIGGSADLLVANPPFYDPAATRPAAEPEVDQARRAQAGDVGDFVEAAARLRSPGGVVCLVLPANLTDQLAATAARVGLRPHSQRFVHARPGEDPRVALVTLGGEGGDAPQLLPPWVERTGDDEESDLAAQLREPGFLTRGGFR